MKKEIHVVGAVIKSNNKILCAQRGPGKSLPYLWEFPGGKIEAGETEKEALEREIREELLCKIEVKNKVTTTRHEYDFGFVNLTTFECDLLEGQPVLTEHVAVKWLAVEELTTLEWAPADIPAIEILMGQTMG
ncbi:(deoxy)nucleoside triphosphate pyrophosphohydrolase [Trichococcus pasteurii]|uniref:8-oxo-dGTP diphosphatase n=1 Tax=Trichococcus pasteurii TaxID=43064 RepID=A0A1W1IFR2_9LACT|nr:(deoxy)nucleoside triphosphate pyrophosphohydrolase [Trichococcus pasteurii]SFE59350.1 8-oxo-dGTP diphosphatase [Trichococcus pasteurii]SLM51848.1 nudix hydrolase [Trichococcus pasteurii]SSB92729.1 nudix hydrolase [Trichococcus pasteurii]